MKRITVKGLLAALLVGAGSLSAMAQATDVKIVSPTPNEDGISVTSSSMQNIQFQFVGYETETPVISEENASKISITYDGEAVARPNNCILSVKDHNVELASAVHFTTPGVYVFTIEAGIISVGDVTNSEIQLTYNLKPGTGKTMEESINDDMLVSPAKGSANEEVTEIAVLCGFGIRWNGTPDIQVMNAAGEAVGGTLTLGTREGEILPEGYPEGYGYPCTVLYAQLSEPIADKGKYSVKIPAEAFFFSTSSDNPLQLKYTNADWEWSFMIGELEPVDIANVIYPGAPLMGNTTEEFGLPCTFIEDPTFLIGNPIVPSDKQAYIFLYGPDGSQLSGLTPHEVVIGNYGDTPGGGPLDAPAKVMEPTTMLQVVLPFSGGPYTTPGTYTVNFGNGLLTLADGSPIFGTLEFEVAGADADDHTFTVDPKEGLIDPFRQIMIVYDDEDVTIAVAEDAKAIIEGPDGYTQESASPAQGAFIAVANAILIGFNDEVSAPGKYTVTIPTGSYTVNEKPNPEIVLNYEIKVPLEVTADPADKSSVETLKAVTLTFSQELTPDDVDCYLAMKDSDGRYSGDKPKYKDANDNELELSASLAQGDDAKTLVLTFVNNGTEYEINVPGEMRIMLETADDTLYVYYTIDGATGIASIFGDAQQFDVYSLQGVVLMRGATAANVQTLPAGLYIINGKKVLVK